MNSLLLALLIIAIFGIVVFVVDYISQRKDNDINGQKRDGRIKPIRRSELEKRWENLEFLDSYSED